MTLITEHNAVSPTASQLPDPAQAAGPFHPFSSDPGWESAWWWLGIPLALTIFLIVTYAISPDWYVKWILPEGYGFLELLHFFMPLAGFIIGLRLLMRPYVRSRRLVLTLTILFTLACLYMAGEEQSWGQHFFHWQTPDAWSEFNRQNETNLHNTLQVFDKTPRLLVEIGIVVGGLLIPVLAVFIPSIRSNRYSLFFPAAALIPAALGAVFFKIASFMSNAGLSVFVARPSEAAETFYYLFILLYMIVYSWRIHELEAEEKNRSTT
jgi:hypothetical protein